ncbi:hypothetical protein, partial [Pseudoalteromonas aurantia]|uniref:hypothetical protein n=1 Tax=Pseudoalteromonas aurantia TaxID=43654 RepID=UPI001BB25EC8
VKVKVKVQVQVQVQVHHELSTLDITTKSKTFKSDKEQSIARYMNTKIGHHHSKITHKLYRKLS